MIIDRYRAVQGAPPALPRADHRRHRLPDRSGHRLCTQGEQAVGTALASPPQGDSLRFGPRIPRRRAGGGKGLEGDSGPAHELGGVPARGPGCVFDGAV